jgi:hypothetical protein
MSLERERQREEHRIIVSAKQQRRKKRINIKENDCLNKCKEIDKDRRKILDVIKDQQ